MQVIYRFLCLLSSEKLVWEWKSCPVELKKSSQRVEKIVLTIFYVGFYEWIFLWLGCFLMLKYSYNILIYNVIYSKRHFEILIFQIIQVRGWIFFNLKASFWQYVRKGSSFFKSKKDHKVEILSELYGLQFLMCDYFFSFSIIISATFLPLISIPPKIGPIRGVPETAEAAIPQTYSPG